MESYVAHAPAPDVRDLAGLAQAGAVAVFEAPSREAVERMTRVAQLDHQRITEVIE